MKGFTLHFLTHCLLLVTSPPQLPNPKGTWKCNVALSPQAGSTDFFYGNLVKFLKHGYSNSGNLAEIGAFIFSAFGVLEHFVLN